jgi:hypothetical protein
MSLVISGSGGGSFGMRFSGGSKRHHSIFSERGRKKSDRDNGLNDIALSYRAVIANICREHPHPSTSAEPFILSGTTNT